MRNIRVNTISVINLTKLHWRYWRWSFHPQSQNKHPIEKSYTQTNNDVKVAGGRVRWRVTKKKNPGAS